MWWMAAAAGWAAGVEVPMAVSLRPGQPARGYVSLTVPLPSRIPRTDEVTSEAGGFTLNCSGRGRNATVALAFELAVVPEHLPDELQCAVGPHTVVIRLTNDLEEAYKAADHPTVRLDQGFAMFALPGEPWIDAGGRAVDSGDQPVPSLVCRVRNGMLWTEVRPGLVAGSYRCLVEGHEPVVIEVLPVE